MYNNQLKRLKLNIDQIYLDPNNPRFWSEQTRGTGDVPDKKIPDEIHQVRSLSNLSAIKFSLEELRNSILRNGFLPLDSIVVRPIDGFTDKFVVIEGNRRLAALKTLREKIDQGIASDEGIDSEYLDKLKESTNEIEVFVYEGSGTKDIAWILQGIRHIGGIKEWEPAQQAKLVAEQIDSNKLSLTEAGQKFGLSAQKVGKRYRSYKALEQMRKDPEFSGKAENEYYSLFEEAIGNVTVKKWLGWDDGEKKFQNTDNLKKFYGWICPDEEHSKGRRRIHNPKHIGYLAKIIDANDSSLLESIESHDIEIEAAHQKLKDADVDYDWEDAFKRVSSLLGQIPNSAIDSNSEEMIRFLDILTVQVDNLKKKALAVKSDGNQV